METIKKKFKYTSMLAALIVFALGVASFLFIYGEVNRKNEEAKSAVQLLETESANKKKIRSLRSFLGDSQSQIDEIEKHFVYRSDVVPFLQFVEQLGEEVSVQTKVSSVEESVDGKELFVSVDAGGSFESVYKFLKLLENAPYKIEVVSMDLRSESGEEGSLWKGGIRMHIISFVP